MENLQTLNIEKLKEEDYKDKGYDLEILIKLFKRLAIKLSGCNSNTRRRRHVNLYS